MRAGAGRRERSGGREGAALRALHAAGCSPHVRRARPPLAPLHLRDSGLSHSQPPGCCRRAGHPIPARVRRGAPLPACGLPRPPLLPISSGVLLGARAPAAPLHLITAPGLQGERGWGGPTRTGDQDISGVDRPVEKTLKKTRDLGSTHRTRLP